MKPKQLRFRSLSFPSQVSLCLGLATLILAPATSHAASQTWSGATDANWNVATNWVGGAVPGIVYTANATNTVDVATFNSAINATTLAGSAANPIIIEANRMIGRIVFDTADVGSYFIGATTGSPTLTFGNGLTIIDVNAAVLNAQTFNAAIALHLPSSTNGNAIIQNNAASTTATLNLVGGIVNSPNSSRGTTWTLQGSNTGENTVSLLTLTNAGGTASNVTKAGTGTWVFTGANTFVAAGGVIINGGILGAANNAALGQNATANAQAAAINNGGTLEIRNGIIIDNGVSLNLNTGGTIRGVGAAATNGRINVSTLAATSVTLATTNSGDLFTIGNAANDVTGGATDSIINVAGAGTILLTQASNYLGGWSLNNGILRLGSATALGDVTTAKVAFGAGSTGRLQLNGNSITVVGLNSDTTTPGTPVVENGAAGSTTLTVNNATANAYAGVLQNGTAGTLGLTKGGMGVLTLGGANTYTDATIINAGTLNVTGSLASGSAVTVNATGILAGTGIVGGAVNIGANARIDPGNAGIGNLTVGSLVLSAGSRLDFDIVNTSNLDRITVANSGGLTINGGQVTINGGTTFFTDNGVYNLIGYSGAISGTGTSALTVNGDNTTVTKIYTFSSNGSFVTLTVADSGIAPRYWNVDANGNWGTAGNWTTGVPNGVSAFAAFGGGGTEITADRTITVDGSYTVGTLAFNGAANNKSYTLAAGVGGSLTLDNGTSASVVTTTAGNHTISVPLVLTSNGVNFSALGANTITVNGVISGTGPLNKAGTGTVELLGNNTFTGAVTINGGTVVINNANSFGNAANAVTLNAATISALSNISSTRSIALGNAASAISVATGATYTLGGVVSGTGTLNKSGTGTLVLSGTNTYTGGTVLNQGTIAINSADSLGASTGNLTLNDGTLQTTATFASTRNIALGNATSTISTDAGTIYTNSGIFSGAGTLNKIGAGTLVLSGANTYTGGTVINSGAVSIATNAGLGTGAVSLNGGTLTTTALITNTHAFTVGPLGGTINVSTNGQYFFNTANTLLGTGPLTVTGNGTLTVNTGNLRIAQTNSYAGVITMTNGGIFEYGVANAVAAGSSFVLGNQGELALNGTTAVSLAHGITVNGGTNSYISFENGNLGIYSGPIVLNSNLTVGLRDWYNYATARSGTISGVISGTGGITTDPGTSATPGTLTLTGTNTYTGATTIGTGTTLQLGNGTTDGTIATTSGVTNNGTLTYNWTTNHEAGYAISGTGALNKLGAGTTTFTGTNTYSGLTTITAGTIQLGNGGTTGSLSGAGTIVNNGSLVINRSNAVTQGTDFSGGPITGTGSFTQAGAGTTTLTAANTYTGATTISGGKLIVNGSLAAGSAVTIGAAGTLGGTGTIGGSVTTAVGGGSRIDLQNGSVGTLTVGSLSLHSGDVLSFDIGTTLGSADSIAITGANGYTFTGAGTAAINLNALGTPVQGSYNIITNAPNINATQFALSSIVLAGKGVSLDSSSGNSLAVVVSDAFGDGAAYWKAGATGTFDPANFSANPDGTGTVTQLGSATSTYFSATSTTSGPTTATVSTSQVIKSLTVLSSHTGSVTLDGTQQLIISGDSSVSGIAGITLQAGAGPLTISTTGGLNVGGVQTWTNNSTSLVTVSSAISGSALTLTGASGNGGYLFTGANTYAGGTAINGTKLTLSGAGSLLDTGAVALSNNGIFDISGITASSETIGDLSGTAGTSVVIGGKTLVANQSNATTFGGVISGTGGLTKQGASSLTLTGVNTYTGATTVNNGVLAIGSGGSIVASASVAIGANGDLDISQSTGATVNQVTGSGQISLGAQTLTINESAAGTFSGVIRDGGIASGIGGGITKTGAGTLTLSGTSTYTGTTLISAGTLNLTGSLASGTVTVNAGTTLNDVAGGLASTAILNNDGTTVLGADDTIATLNNTGTLNGTGFTLTATTYNLNGGSQINAQLGAGTLNANGTVAINAATAAGTVNIQTGTTTLGATEQLADTAAVTITTGATLNLGGAEKIGTLAGAGTLNNAGFGLTVDGGTFSGNIGGTGGLTKTGSGTLALSGTNTYTGATTVSAGILQITSTGSLANTATTVSSGAILANNGIIAGTVSLSGILTGNGTVQGNVTSNSGSAIDLRDSTISTITLSGGLTLAGGSTIYLEVGATAGSNDQVLLGNSLVSATGTTTITLQSLVGTPESGSYTLLSGASGGIDEDNFAVTAINGYNFTLTSNGTNLVLTLSRTTFVEDAETPNQIAVATALETVAFNPGSYSPEFQNVLNAINPLSPEARRAAFDQISPAFHSGAITLASGLSQATAGSLFQSLSARSMNSVDYSDPYAGDYLWDIWGQATGYFSDGGMSLIPGEDFKSGTYLVGANRNLTHNTSIGIFGGYGDGTGDFADSSSIDLERQFVGGFLTYVNGGFYMNAAVGGGNVDYDSKRRIQFGTLDRTATGSTSGEELFAVIGGGYDFKFGDFTVGPQASLQRSSVKLDGFNETGADSLNLGLDDTEYTSLRSQLGARMTYTLQTESALAIVPFVQTFWQHEYEDSQDDIRSTLDAGNGPEFGYTSSQGDQDSVVFGAGLSFDVGETFQAVFSYNRDGGNGGSDTMSATANFKF